MPTLAQLFIKTALVYLGAALLVGVVMAGGVLYGFGGAYGMLWPVYLHLFVVGWLTELIFGVAYWLFPRFSRERPHGTTWPVAASYGLLNGGLLLRTVAEPARVGGGAPGWGWALTASALLQVLGALCFVIYIWSRVKPK